MTTDRSGHHVATPRRGIEIDNMNPEDGSLLEIATWHETITPGVNIPSLRNRWAQWGVEQWANER